MLQTKGWRTIMTRIITMALLATLVACCAGVAEEIHSIQPAVGAVCLTTDQPIAIDGELSDAAWQQAPVVSGFRISALEVLAPNQTEFMVLRDADTLYLGVRCHEENMAGLVETVTMRDGSVWHDDDVEFFLDANHDHHSFYQFMANALGTRFDSKTGSSTWDTDWEAAASKQADAWLLEVAIPFASLDAQPPAVGDVWGMNVCRERRAGRDQVLQNWANVQGNFLRPWLFGHIYFAGESFELTDALAREIHAAIGVPVELYLPGRLALVGPKGIESSRTWQEMLAAEFGQAGELKELHAELAQTFAQNADAPHRDEFAPLDERFAQLKGLATGAEPVSPAQWAKQTIQINRLETELHELKWKVRTALLLQEA